MEISTLMNKICLLKPTLEMYVLRYPLNAEEADQLVQDTLIKALLEADSYSDTLTLKHWLFSLMKEKYNESYENLANTVTTKKRKAVSMRVIHNGLRKTGEPEFLTKAVLEKVIADKIDEFDADLQNHEQQLPVKQVKVKEA